MHRSSPRWRCAPPLALAACGDDDADDDRAPTPPTTTATAGDAQQPSTDAGDAPERIVSLSPTATEILFAIGAGDQVVAVDDQSNYPEGVPDDRPVGLRAERRGDRRLRARPRRDRRRRRRGPRRRARGRRHRGARRCPAADDPRRRLRPDRGARRGHRSRRRGRRARRRRCRRDIDELVAAVPEREEAPTYYHELDNTLFSVTSKTFIGEVYALAGLENIADAADPTAAGGYPQLSAEFIVAGRPRPRLPGRHQVLRAVRRDRRRPAGLGRPRPRCGEGHVVELDDDIASRWGPRVVDLLAHDRRGHRPRCPVGRDRHRGCRRPPSLADPAARRRLRARMAGGRGGGRWPWRCVAGARDRAGVACRSGDVVRELLDGPRRRTSTATAGARSSGQLRLPAGRARPARRGDARGVRGRLPGRVPQPAGRPVPARRGGRRRPRRHARHRRQRRWRGSTPVGCAAGRVRRRARRRRRSPTCSARPATRAGPSTASLILAGVAVASFLTAMQTYVQQRNQDTIREVYTWILGPAQHRRAGARSRLRAAVRRA